ncbi:NAD-dependent epimerase/dehydratase family protein [Streptacidiphilus cavernicola]|uniref:NAD-dependent epimerase/dehydratase family protein n=1 Tax=Streptacidiphilus cavernicola TaxID=3342716 RepID=A0ABV6VSG8_9ACTN
MSDLLAPSSPPHALVTGGAGFIGSHLCERLLADGYRVTCLDNLSTGSLRNIAGLTERPGFAFREHDATEGLGRTDRVDLVFHLASAASPPQYQRRAVETLRAGSVGLFAALDLAARDGARLVFASSSEVYGDPEEHPQPESYRGRVSTTGPRSMYDEAKRFGEAACAAYRTSRGVDAKIARLFNTYGPRMDPDDGRMLPTFIRQALDGEPLTVHGTGRQTRSLCYVDDTVDGLVRLARGSWAGPVNIGGSQELTVNATALAVLEAVGGHSPITYLPALPDDPARRRPDTALALRHLGWRQTTGLDDGMRATVAWFRERLAARAVAG